MHEAFVNPASGRYSIVRYEGCAGSGVEDQVAVEEPLEIRVAFGGGGSEGVSVGGGERVIKAIAVTMRTPTGGGEAGGDLEMRVERAGVDGKMRTGTTAIHVQLGTAALQGRVPQDFELAVGFLFSEGVIREVGEVERVVYCGPEVGVAGVGGVAGAGRAGVHNVVRVELRAGVAVDMGRLERHFFTHSSCGVCGKTTIEALRMLRPVPIGGGVGGGQRDGGGGGGGGVVVGAELLHALPEFLRESQAVFDRTGGLHAAALFDLSGKLVAVREDVGRHNALDKLIGSQFLAGALGAAGPASRGILLVSGRASFELLQKTIMAGIPVIAAVGAPSSLAVELAREFGVTLVGFLRGGRFNVYAGEGRIGAAVSTNIR